jgi:hypothetical protein
MGDLPLDPPSPPVEPPLDLGLLWEWVERAFIILLEWAPQLLAIVALSLALGIAVIELIKGTRKASINVSIPGKRKIAPKLFIISMV